jgi:hypothetical protein
MIGSLIKELIARRRGETRGAPEPYFDYPSIAKGVAANAQRLLAEGYLDYPVFVHLETLAVCNAACDFCPYIALARKGTRMPDALIEKVIDDLTAIPPDLPFQLAPYKVSDPFLEPRLFDIMELAAARLPGMGISLITNGTALVERQVERLVKQPRVRYVNVSLNYDNAEEYEAVMHLPFERTLSRLDALHKRKAAGGIPFPVHVTRVSTDRSSDRRFVAWASARYPAFPALIIPRNDWIGEVVTEGSVTQVLDAPCHRWFDLSITATGIVAMCCMDGHSQYPKGDVNTQNALEIYNQPQLRELRQTLISRRHAGSPCDRCTYLVS